jgi:hypothetical protein
MVPGGPLALARLSVGALRRVTLGRAASNGLSLRKIGAETLDAPVGNVFGQVQPDVLEAQRGRS